MCYFWAGRNVLSPTFPVSIRARIQVQCGWHAFAQKFLMYDRDPLQTVQIVPSRLVYEQAVVGCGHEGDTKMA
jgi:hypothetical protein